MNIDNECKNTNIDNYLINPKTKHDINNLKDSLYLLSEKMNYIQDDLFAQKKELKEKDELYKNEVKKMEDLLFGECDLDAKYKELLKINKHSEIKDKYLDDNNYDDLFNNLNEINKNKDIIDNEYQRMLKDNNDNENYTQPELKVDLHYMDKNEENMNNNSNNNKVMDKSNIPSNKLVNNNSKISYIYNKKSNNSNTNNNTNMKINNNKTKNNNYFKPNKSNKPISSNNKINANSGYTKINDINDSSQNNEDDNEKNKNIYKDMSVAEKMTTFQQNMAQMKDNIITKHSKTSQNPQKISKNNPSKLAKPSLVSGTGSKITFQKVKYHQPNIVKCKEKSKNKIKKPTYHKIPFQNSLVDKTKQCVLNYIRNIYEENDDNDGNDLVIKRKKIIYKQRDKSEIIALVKNLIDKFDKIDDFLKNLKLNNGQNYYENINNIDINSYYNDFYNYYYNQNQNNVNNNDENNDKNINKNKNSISNDYDSIDKSIEELDKLIKMPYKIDLNDYEISNSSSYYSESKINQNFGEYGTNINNNININFNNEDNDSQDNSVSKGEIITDNYSNY